MLKRIVLVVGMCLAVAVPAAPAAASEGPCIIRPYWCF